MRIGGYVWSKSTRVSGCACGQVRDIARGEVVESIRNGRMVRRGSIHIEEIRRRRYGSDLRSRTSEDGIPVRILYGRRGGDLVKTTQQDRPRGGYSRGWLIPNARWAGICTDCEGEMRWGGDVIGWGGM